MGTELVMKPWSPSIIARPSRVRSPPEASPSTTGMASSMKVPACARRVATADGRRSLGNERYMRLRTNSKGSTGLLLTITPTTAGKWWFSFETPAQNQSASCTALAPEIQFPAKRKQATVVR